MKLIEAQELISKAFYGKKSNQVWADLGCGSGLFSQALSNFMGKDCVIHAVDKSHQEIQAINDTEIRFVQKDFEKEELNFPPLDGILMANSLHFVKDKGKLLPKLIENLKSSGQFILIEYDTEVANPWVPYPINKKQAIQLFKSFGFNEYWEIGKRNSVYSSAKIYALQLKRNTAQETSFSETITDVIDFLGKLNY